MNKKLQAFFFGLLLVFSNANAGYDMSADNDKISGTLTTALDADGSNGVTLAVWVYKTAAQWSTVAGDECIALSNLDSTSTSSVIIRTASTADQIKAGTWSDSGSLREDVFTFADTTWDDTWVLLVSVYDGNSDREMFVDGTGTGTPHTTLADVDTMGFVGIGQSAFSNFSECEGLVAEAVIFNIALSDTQVSDLNAGGAETALADPCSVAPNNCVGWWSLDTDYGASAGAVLNQATGTAADATGDLDVISAAPFSGATYPNHPHISATNVSSLLVTD